MDATIVVSGIVFIVFGLMAESGWILFARTVSNKIIRYIYLAINSLLTLPAFLLVGYLFFTDPDQGAVAGTSMFFVGPVLILICLVTTGLAALADSLVKRRVAKQNQSA